MVEDGLDISKNEDMLMANKYRKLVNITLIIKCKSKPTVKYQTMCRCLISKSQKTQVLARMYGNTETTCVLYGKNMLVEAIRKTVWRFL